MYSDRFLQQDYYWHPHNHISTYERGDKQYECDKCECNCKLITEGNCMSTKLLIVFVISTVMCPILLSQVSPTSSDTRQGPPTTVKEALLRYGIASDEQSLLLALGNSDPKVRGLAAIQLGVEKGEGALAALLTALVTEKDPGAKVTIAAEVSRLGDEAGAVELRIICDDKTASANIRLQAARHLQDVKDDHCYQMIEDLAAAAPDPDSRIEALYLLTSAESISRHDTLKVRRVILGALRDGDVRVRLAASNKIALIGKRSDALSLKRAIAAERDANARSSMEAELQTLLNK